MYLTMLNLIIIYFLTYLNKYSKCNSFEVTTDLLNNNNLKVAIT